MATTPAIMQVVELEHAIWAGVEAAQRAFDRLFAPAQLDIGSALGRGLPEGMDAETPAVGVMFEVYGPVRAHLGVVVPESCAAVLAAALLRRGPGALDQPGREAFTELANILSSAFLNGMAARARMTLVPSVPRVVHDGAGRLVATFAPGNAAVTVPFDTDLPRGHASGLLLVAPDSASIETLVRAVAGR